MMIEGGQDTESPSLYYLQSIWPLNWTATQQDLEEGHNPGRHKIVAGQSISLDNINLA